MKKWPDTPEESSLEELRAEFLRAKISVGMSSPGETTE
jgi:hypothetical protein